MENLIKLQILNLFKKYEYLISEFEIKNEISNLSQGIFKENVKKVLNGRDIDKNLDKIEQITDKENNELTFNPEEDDDVVIDDSLKSLYRKIVKLTHPDKVKNDYLNILYIQASQAIEKNDKLNILRICFLLNIEVGIPEEIVESIENEIKTIEKKILFLESSYHMRWHNSTKEKKIDIMVDYLKKQLTLC